jgi:hypothetical protein
MVRNTKRRVVVNLEGEEWTLEYDSAANYLTMVGEGQNFGLQPGEIDLADDQRELLERDSSLAGKLKAQMMYAPYEGTSFEGDGVIPDLLDALLIRLVLGQPLAARYELQDNELRRAGGRVVAHMPTTGVLLLQRGASFGDQWLRFSSPW